MNRMDRINSELKRQLSVVLQDGVRDPRVAGTMISVMEVSADKDLTLAKVYVSIFGADGREDEVIEGLNSAQGYIKSCLKNKIMLRAMPQLRFIKDNSIAYGMKMDKRLSELEYGNDSEQSTD